MYDVVDTPTLVAAVASVLAASDGIVSSRRAIPRQWLNVVEYSPESSYWLISSAEISTLSSKTVG